MEMAEVGVVTVTLVRDAKEERVMRRALTRLVGLGLPVVAADGGSGADFVDFLKNLGVRVVQPRKRGLVPQVKAAVAEAQKNGRNYLLYTEPDKFLFFDGRLEEFIERIRAGAKFGLALAARDESSFRSFPEWQQFTERTMNRVAGELAGVGADYCYGPLLLRTEDAPIVKAAWDDLGWGWRFFLLGALAGAGRRVQSVVMECPCPKDQQRERTADRRYRSLQLKQNLDGLFRGIDFGKEWVGR